MILGTIDFLSPEQIKNSSYVDGRSDVYGLGGTLYFLLTGRSPVGDGTMTEKLVSHITREPTPVESVRIDLDVK